ncbi:MAG TPA: DUF2071 domain-containing protein [Sorangium sp.]|nr:DUF2071 domain-containing protein [Sorangium sp.]
MSIERQAWAQRPHGRPAGFQRWRQLLFLHWNFDPSELAPTLPAGLQVDTFRGKAYVGVVPFTMRDVAPWWSPPVPGISHFHELNVRTYVLYRGQPGVWFYSLEAAATIAVVVARVGWGLPYHRASIQLKTHAEQLHYRSRRLWPGPRPAHFRADYSLGAALGAAQPGTLEHFLVERYLLFTERKPGVLQRGQVHHRPYPLQDVTVHTYEESMLAAAGLSRPEQVPIAHYSPGVDVDVYALTGT